MMRWMDGYNQCSCKNRRQKIQLTNNKKVLFFQNVSIICLDVQLQLGVDVWWGEFPFLPRPICWVEQVLVKVQQTRFQSLFKIHRVKVNVIDFQTHRRPNNKVAGWQTQKPHDALDLVPVIYRDVVLVEPIFLPPVRALDLQ